MVHFLITVLFAVALAAAGAIQRDTHLVVASSGFRVAMDPLHWAMHAVLYRRISSAVETGRIGGAFDCC